MRTICWHYARERKFPRFWTQLLDTVFCGLGLPLLDITLAFFAKSDVLLVIGSMAKIAHNPRSGHSDIMGHACISPWICTWSQLATDWPGSRHPHLQFSWSSIWPHLKWIGETKQGALWLAHSWFSCNCFTRWVLILSRISSQINPKSDARCTARQTTFNPGVRQCN